MWMCFVIYNLDGAYFDNCNHCFISKYESLAWDEFELAYKHTGNDPQHSHGPTTPSTTTEN